jgi:hypothetical protein
MLEAARVIQEWRRQRHDRGEVRRIRVLVVRILGLLRDVFDGE